MNPKLTTFTHRDLDAIPQLQRLAPRDRLAMRAVASILPFRVNNYVIDELVNWSDIPSDPIFQLTFPQPGMLAPDHLARMSQLLASGADRPRIAEEATRIRLALNPHPGEQKQMNVPRLHGEPVPGVQHKYAETVLFFPSPGQTCHAYCTYCFRWAQFVGMEDLKFAHGEASVLVDYVHAHPEVRSVLLTGGDPMVMKSSVLRRYIEPLLAIPQLESIRIGTKSLAYWPYRFTTDDDASDILRLFSEVVARGKNLAFMAHFSHPRELQTAAVAGAIARIRETGAVIRSQAPLIRRVNDCAADWVEMWRLQTRMGIVPYYMFVERDTGASRYFELPLVRALEIFQNAYSSVSGLARTVRGPSMSATPGKVLLDGIADVNGEKVFVLQFLQARDPRWVGRPFFAQFDANATWMDDLRPALGASEFFFEPAMRSLRQESGCETRPEFRVLPGDARVDRSAGFGL